MLLTLSSAGLLYAACVALYHADPKRSQFESLRTAARGPGVLRSAAAAMIVAALFVLASRIGWDAPFPSRSAYWLAGESFVSWQPFSRRKLT